MCRQGPPPRSALSARTTLAVCRAAGPVGTGVPNEETRRTESGASATRTGDDRCGGGGDDGGGGLHRAPADAVADADDVAAAMRHSTIIHDTLSRLPTAATSVRNARLSRRVAPRHGLGVARLSLCSRPSLAYGRCRLSLESIHTYVHTYTRIQVCVIRCQSAKKSATEETDGANRAASERADTIPSPSAPLYPSRIRRGGPRGSGPGCIPGGGTFGGERNSSVGEGILRGTGTASRLDLPAIELPFRPVEREKRFDSRRIFREMSITRGIPLVPRNTWRISVRQHRCNKYTGECKGERSREGTAVNNYFKGSVL